MRSRIFAALALTPILLLAACGGDVGDHIDSGGTERISTELDSSQPVLVTTPKDAANAKGSGAEVAHLVDQAFSRYARLVDITPKPYRAVSDFSETVAENNYGYIVVPEIRNWQTGNQRWSKESASVNVDIVVYDALTGAKLSSTDLFGQKTSATLNPLTWFTDHAATPQALLATPLSDYADHAYGCDLCLHL